MVGFSLQEGPTHHDMGQGILWTHVNVGEAVPGVVTPLTASFWRRSHEETTRIIYHDLGVIAASEIDAPFAPETVPVTFLLGRMAANVDFLRFMADRLPGTSGAALEAQMLGSERPDAKVHDDKSRYLHVAWGFVKLLTTMPSRVRAMEKRTMTRWQRARDAMPTVDYAAALEWFRWEAIEGNDEVMSTHGLTALLSPVVWEPLANIVRRAGDEDDVLTLSAGLGDVKEAGLMAALYDIAQSGASLDDFIQHHGFMGPDCGELSNPSWRADPSALNAAIRGFKTGGPSPFDRQAASKAKAATTLAKIRAALPLWQRPLLSAARFLCANYLPLREIGKAAMGAHADIGRLAAERLGALLTRSGAIDEAADVFYLTLDELKSPKSFDLASIIADRKQVRAEFQTLSVPDKYTVDDLPDILGGKFARTETDRIVGIGVSKGIVEGVVRVVEGPADFASFEAGEILVCKTTDPGWSPVFTIASAMIVDVGGMLSHSAIIARELQVPAVVNTGHGTRQLSTGQRVRVDGASGEVTVLDGSIAMVDEAVDSGDIDPRNTASPPLNTLYLNAMGDAVLLKDAMSEQRFGGKAASLAHAIKGGLPVPPGLAFGYDADFSHQALITSLPDFGGPVAVRSSGIGEDGVGASFAGQHDTILGVEGPAAIADAIISVAGSAMNDHALQYRKEMGDDSTPRIGVVVQQLVPSEIAGVMFTRDPMADSGDNRHRIIEAAWGLGEVVVGSLVTPDYFKISNDGALVEFHAGDKRIYMDGTGAHAVTAAAATARTLTDKHLSELNDLAIKVESHYGAPQDIEWAYASGTLYLLQSRPITTK